LTTNKIYKECSTQKIKKMVNKKLIGLAAFFLILYILITFTAGPTGIEEVIQPWTGIVIGILFLLIGFLSLINILKISPLNGFLLVIVGIIFILFGYRYNRTAA